MRPSSAAEFAYIPAACLSDRRATVRFDCSFEAFAVPVTGERSFLTCPGRVWDVSRHGIGLLMARDFPLRTLLVMEIELGEGVLSRPLQARVVHCKGRGDQEWIVGCEFITPLSNEELLMLV